MINVERYRRLPTEQQMHEAIEQAVGNHGRVFHIRDSRATPEMEDFLDLFILLPPYMGSIELKSQRRKVTPGQRDVAELARSCTRSFGGIVRPDPLVNEWAYDDLIGFLESVRNEDHAFAEGLLAPIRRLVTGDDVGRR